MDKVKSKSNAYTVKVKSNQSVNGQS